MKATSPSTFLDTNVLVYVFDDDEPAKQQRARELLAASKPAELAVSAQVLGEFYVTVTRKLARPLDPEIASEAIESFSRLTVVPLDSTVVRSAIQLSRSAQISYWDSLVVTAAARCGCERLLSEDLSDGQELGPVRIENPFRGVRRESQP